MKKAVFVLEILFLFTLTSVYATDVSQKMQLYPAMQDAIKSDYYQVFINKKEAFAEKMSKFDVPLHYTHLACASKTTLSIEVKTKENISSYTISPKSKNIVATINNNVLHFEITGPQYLIVKINEKEDLFVLIDECEKKPVTLTQAGVKSIMVYGIDNSGSEIMTKTIQQAIDEASTTKTILYFPPGIYVTGELYMRSNVTLYLEAGAQLKGSTHPGDYKNALIRFDNVSNVKILGRGVIDGSGWSGLRKNGAKEIYLLFLSRCDNILIDGPVLRDPCFWNTRVFQSANVHMRNVKVLNNRPEKNWTNTDGIDFDSSTDCDVINAILHCGDDNVVVKGLDDKDGYNTERLLFEKIVTLSNSAAAKIGTETCVKRFKDITFKDIDVVKCKRAMVINGFDSSAIQDIKFIGFNIEGFDFNGREGPRVIDFEVTNNSWRECVGNCTIDNVLIQNIRIYPTDNNVESHIYGRTSMFRINNIRIRNYRLNQEKITSLKEGNIVTNEHAYNVSVL